MSSDDAHPPPQHKPSSSSFADVFKTLAAGRQKSQSPVSHSADNGGMDPLPYAAEGRRGSRITFGFESLQLQRGSATTNTSEPRPPPDFQTVLQTLDKHEPISAAEEAETVSRHLHSYTADQAVAIWEAAHYLVDESSPIESRASGSKLMQAIANRPDLSPTARQTLFETISGNSTPDVISSRVNSLIALTDHGRKSDFTNVSILPIVASWTLPLYDAAVIERSKQRKAKNPRTSGSSQCDEDLSELFHFVVDIITLQRHPPIDEDIAAALKQIFTVCKRTSATSDIKLSLQVFDAIILSAEIPESCFINLLEVLCSIHASVKSLSGPTSRTVRNLAKSRRQLQVVEALHSLLDTPDSDARNLNVARGAVYIFKDLVGAYGQDSMPQVSWDPLITSLENAAMRDDGRIDADLLEVCLNMLEGDFANVALDQDWTGFIRILIKATHRIVEKPNTSPPAVPPNPQLSPTKATNVDEVYPNILASISRLTGLIEKLWPRLNSQQAHSASEFFMEVHAHIGCPQANLALDLYRKDRLCHVDHENWETNSWKLLRDFIQYRPKPCATRILALEVFRDAYFNEDTIPLFKEKGFLTALADDFSGEEDVCFLQKLVELLVDTTTLCKDDDTFNLLVGTMSSPMAKDQKDDDQGPSVTSPPTQQLCSSTTPPDSSLSNVACKGLVRLFLRSLSKPGNRAAVIFEKLIDIVRSGTWPSDSRLTALNLLFKLRSDSVGSIWVTPTPQNDYLATLLCRTADASRQNSVDEGSLERNVRSEDSARTPAKDSSSTPMSRSSVRGMSTQFKSFKLEPPLWASMKWEPMPEAPTPSHSPYTVAYADPETPDSSEETPEPKSALKINIWLEAIIALLQREKDWNVYSYVLAHLGSQLSNKDFYKNAIPQVKLLRSVMCEQIKNGSFHEPPGWSGVKKSEVALCLFDSLSFVVGYHKHFAKSEEDEIVRTFMLGIGSWDGTSRGCIHALTVCCFEIPLSMTKSLNAILDKMSKVITRAHIAVHILEFLALLARLPDVYVNLRDEEIRTVFGICIRYLQTSREQQNKALDPTAPQSRTAPSRLSGGIRELASANAEPAESLNVEDLSRYVYTLTYHVMIFWFLSLKLQDRPKHVGWITKSLVFTDDRGKDVVEEQSQVLIDMMQRVAYSDLGETIPYEKFPPSPADGPVSKKSWVVGLSIITVETAGASGLSQITKRQASGTTYATYQQLTAPVLPHHIRMPHDSRSVSDDPATRTAVLPSHVLMQMTTSAFPTPMSMQPIPLLEDDLTRRAISTFDRNDIVDGHKVGVLYVGEGQTTEAEILSNTTGSPDYENFLSGLGTKVQIKNAPFNTQGLHCDIDGDSTYAWRDRVTEIVFHIPTMMPTNLEADPQCINKKRHIGNDMVNIIFNRSNLDFNFNTIPSQFNFVNIVISPANRIAYSEETYEEPCDPTDCFYVVHVMCKPGFPELSAATKPKIISGKNLASFVRLIALNASVLSLVWNREGGEHVSAWLNRLREIRRLRNRISALNHDNPEIIEGMSATSYRRNTKANVYAEESQARPPARSHSSADWTPTTNSTITEGLDFSRWSR
ncbi:Tuberous sclerosis 2-like protein [Arachnomyces sp. PD_36]|nr:Tuberous sclerosis 2-like protein [Arachnomyces sp. PD_36]